MQFLNNLFSAAPCQKSIFHPLIIPAKSGPVKLKTLCSFFTLTVEECYEGHESGEGASYQKKVERNFPRIVRDIKSRKKYAVDDEKDQHACNLYNVVLIKIVNLIKKQQYLLKNSKLSLEERTQAEAFVVLFELYYVKYLNKYREIPPGKTNVMSLVFNEICSNIPFLKNIKRLTPKEIEYQKQLADMGYEVSNELEKWLATEVKDPNIPFSQIVNQQFKEFLTWADKHPRAASHLAADIALTCATLLDQNATDAFFMAMNAKTCSRLFLDALGLCPEYEEVETKEMLKFRALADLLSYCPLVATGYKITKKATTGHYTSFLQWALDAVKATGETAAIQMTIRMIPQEQESIVRIAIALLRGKEIQKIVMHERNFALLQMSGAVRQVLTNPSGVFESYEIWWQTIFHSTGDEKKERIQAELLLPTLAVASFATLFFLNLTGAITASLLSSIILALSAFLRHQIDRKYGFKTRREVVAINEKKKKEEELLQAHHFLTTDLEKKEQITKEVNQYIRDLQRQFALPVIPETHAKKQAMLDAKDLDFINTTNQKIEGKLNRIYRSKEMPVKALDVTTLFNKVLDLKKLRIKLQEYPKGKIDTIVFSIADDLIKGWLQTRLEQAFRNKCLNSLYKEKDPNCKSKKPIVSTTEYLNNHPELQKHPEFLKALLIHK